MGGVIKTDWECPGQQWLFPGVLALQTTGPFPKVLPFSLYLFNSTTKQNTVSANPHLKVKTTLFDLLQSV